jgi:hypothetical protein
MRDRKIRGKEDGGKEDELLIFLSPIFFSPVFNALCAGLLKSALALTEGLQQLRETIGRPFGEVRKPTPNASVFFFAPPDLVNPQEEINLFFTFFLTP